MQKTLVVSLGLSLAVVSGACARQEPGTLQAASEAHGVTQLRSIEYSGTGKWFQFGQAPNPTLPWPAFNVSSFTASINYETPAARVAMERIQAVEPDRVRPAPAQQRPVQVVGSTYAWSMTNPPGAAPGSAPAPQPQPAAVEERTMEIWTTPHGFLKAAAANNATSQPAEGGSEISFTMGGKHRYVGRINAQNQVERVQTWIDNTVLGDTPVDIRYSDYRDFNGVMFPARIVRTQGGHPVLDLTVSAVTANPAVDLQVPDQVRTFSPPPVNVAVETLADGVYYLKGGSHHSVAIDQRDHIVVVEAPQDEARSTAVIAKVKETIPGKPIRYVINSHVHFDHSGGLRSAAAEGATIITQAQNKPYFEKAFASPNSISPDALAKSGKKARFQAVEDKLVLRDGTRTVELYRIEDSHHTDSFLVVYLPKEKLLIEADSFTPGPPNAPVAAQPNPNHTNLVDNLARLGKPVDKILPLHGRVVPASELYVAVGQTPPK